MSNACVACNLKISSGLDECSCRWANKLLISYVIVGIYGSKSWSGNGVKLIWWARWFTVRELRNYMIHSIHRCSYLMIALVNFQYSPRCCFMIHILQGHISLALLSRPAFLHIGIFCALERSPQTLSYKSTTKPPRWAGHYTFLCNSECNPCFI